MSLPSAGARFITHWRHITYRLVFRSRLVNKQAQLSFVIIPVVSSILAILIVMCGIAYHLQQRQRHTVEVADFDFQHRENLDEKTFMERVKESFASSFARHSLSAGGRGTSYGGMPYDDHSDFETSNEQPAGRIRQAPVEELS